MYIVSYYKGDSEYKFKLFIRIKYNRFSKKVANITVHIDDHEVNGEYDKILSPKILKILMANIINLRAKEDMQATPMILEFHQNMA